MSSIHNGLPSWPRAATAVALVAWALSVAGAPSPSSAVLALGDFDADGVDDLVVAQDGGIEIRRGTLAAYVPRWAGAKHASAEPFGRGRRVPAPSAHWLAAGDFDNDGRLDVALAQRGARSISVLRGDGRGALAAPQRIELAGAVGAFASGDVDRPDGLRDLVVAIAGDDGHAALVVLAGPRGAVRAAPRTIALPWMPSHLAVGAFDGHVANDIALAGGERVAFLQGRDRDFPDPAAGPEAVSYEHVLGAPVRALAHGDLVADRDALEDLAVLDADGVLHTFAARGSARSPAQRGRRVEPLRLAASRADLGLGAIGADARLLAGRYDDSVTQTLLVLDAGRAALVTAGPHAKVRTAPLDAKSGVRMHAVPRRGADGRTELVAIEHERTRVSKGLSTQTLTVNSSDDAGDGTCDATHCSLRDALVAANATPAGVGVRIEFDIAAGGAIPAITPAQPLPVATRSLVIDGTTQSAGYVEISGATVSLLPDANDGLVFEGAATVVRGLVVNRFDGYLVTIRGNGSIVEGNRIGTTASGAGNPDPDGDTLGGLRIDASGVRVGGTAGTTPLGACTGACNLIGGVPGIGLVGTSAGDTLLVQGNHFGVAADGTGFLPTRSFAMHLRATSTVGGPTPPERNVFGAAGYGGNTSPLVRFELTLARTLFQGNFVGTDTTGTIAGGGVDGVSNFSFDSVFGGTAGVTPGGPCTGACNLFSGNTDEGMELEGSGERNVVQGNLFGLDRTGLAALPNATYGLEVRDDDNLIGGTVPEAANVFSGNAEYGVRISTGGPNGPVRILGNRIGTDASGDAPVPNALGGVLVGDGRHVVGGVGPGEANLIAGNGGTGIAVYADAAFPAVVFARGNAIRDNGALGIDHGDTGDDGVTANDSGDADPALPNFPSFAASASDTATNIVGVIERPAAQALEVDLHRVDACDASGNGEGAERIGTFSVPAGAAGAAPFDGALPPLPAGTILTATSTFADDGTSEFSACVTVDAETPVDLALAMSVDAQQARAGGNVTYTLEIAHLSGPGVDDATLVVALPPGTVAGVVSGATCTASTSLLTCSTGPIAAGAALAVSVPATLPGSATDGQVLVANASVSSAVADPDLADNADSASVVIENDDLFTNGFE